MTLLLSGKSLKSILTDEKDERFWFKNYITAITNIKYSVYRSGQADTNVYSEMDTIHIYLSYYKIDHHKWIND